jgi:predicted dehydrogenase
MVLQGALLGCGQVSQHHLRAWAQIENAKIVALYNRTISKAENRAREFGIPIDHVYSDYHELLQNEKIDFVDIATSPNVHRENVEAAAQKGVAVLCQKPLAPSLEDALHMIDVCDKANVPLVVNENWRWRSWYRDLKGILDSNVIGRPRYVRVFKHRRLTLPAPGDSSIPLAAEPSALGLEKLIVHSWGIHLIDTLRFLFNEIDTVYAQLDKVSSMVDGEDRAVILLSMKGITGVIDISWATVLENADEMNLDIRPENVLIEGDEGTIELLEFGNAIRIITRDTTTERLAYDGEFIEAYQASYTAAQQHFIDCLISQKVPETVARDNLKTLKITFAAYESYAKGQVVSID